MKMTLLLICALLFCSCATIRNANYREDFDKSVKSYNRMLRWQEVENAGMRFIDTDLRDEFMKTAESMKKRGVTIADYRVLTSECLPDKGTAEVLVDFDYYMLPSNRIKTVTYRQQWIIREMVGINIWRLKTPLPAFD